MTVSKAQQKATAKYIKNNYDEMKIRIKKGAKQLYKPPHKNKMKV